MKWYVKLIHGLVPHTAMARCCSWLGLSDITSIYFSNIGSILGLVYATPLIQGPKPTDTQSHANLSFSFSFKMMWDPQELGETFPQHATKQQQIKIICYTLITPNACSALWYLEHIGLTIFHSSVKLTHHCTKCRLNDSTWQSSAHGLCLSCLPVHRVTYDMPHFCNRNNHKIYIVALVYYIFSLWTHVVFFWVDFQFH